MAHSSFPEASTRVYKFLSLSTDSLLDDLNPPQREAVLHGDGPLLVFAGAGSGKTRVITRRIAHLIRQRGEQAVPATVSTFHSAAAIILRRDAERVGLTRSFVIYDDADQLQVVKRAMKEAGIDPTLIGPREILWRIDQQKNLGRPPVDM